ncbi:MAG: hypothetical protein R2879_04710 [Saprospiraceae bacterium]
MKTFTFLAISLFLLSFGEKNMESTSFNRTVSRTENSSVERNSNKVLINTNNTILLKVDGESYSINDVSQDDSYLKFYAAGSDMNHDADFEIVSNGKAERLTVIIDGLDGKGKDKLSGTVRFGETNSLVTFKKGDLLISFTEGELIVEEVAKATGLAKLKASGLCTIKKGKSYTGMKLDVPGELEVKVTLSDVKTLDYKR